MVSGFPIPCGLAGGADSSPGKANFFAGKQSILDRGRISGDLESPQAG
jgi:hypothetical protein